MTLREYYNSLDRKYLLVYGYSTPYTKTPNYMENYKLDYPSIDPYIIAKYGDCVLFSENVSDITQVMSAYMFMNTYKHTALYETTLLEYNPLWNVDGTEVTESKHAEVNRTHTEKAYSDSTNEKGYNFPFNDSVKKTQGAENEITNDKGDREHHDITPEYTDTITITRQGNIGVTKTTDLINSQRDTVNFVFWNEIFKDVLNAIAIPYYNYEEEHETWI